MLGRGSSSVEGLGLFNIVTLEVGGTKGGGGGVGGLSFIMHSNCLL